MFTLNANRVQANVMKSCLRLHFWLIHDCCFSKQCVLFTFFLPQTIQTQTHKVDFRLENTHIKVRQRKSHYQPLQTVVPRVTTTFPPVLHTLLWQSHSQVTAAIRLPPGPLICLGLITGTAYRLERNQGTLGNNETAWLWPCGRVE